MRRNVRRVLGPLRWPRVRSSLIGISRPIIHNSLQPLRTNSAAEQTIPIDKEGSQCQGYRQDLE